MQRVRYAPELTSYLSELNGTYLPAGRSRGDELQPIKLAESWKARASHLAAIHLYILSTIIWRNKTVTFDHAVPLDGTPRLSLQGDLRLQQAYVHSTRPLAVHPQIESEPLILSKCFQASFLDGADVDESIVPIIILDESKAFRRLEPLYSSGPHRGIPLVFVAKT
jgi:hypothetical protein